MARAPDKDGADVGHHRFPWVEILTGGAVAAFLSGTATFAVGWLNFLHQSREIDLKYRAQAEEIDLKYAQQAEDLDRKYSRQAEELAQRAAQQNRELDLKMIDVALAILSGEKGRAEDDAKDTVAYVESRRFALKALERSAGIDVPDEVVDDWARGDPIPLSSSYVASVTYSSPSYSTTSYKTPSYSTTGYTTPTYSTPTYTDPVLCTELKRRQDDGDPALRQYAPIACEDVPPTSGTAP